MTIDDRVNSCTGYLPWKVHTSPAVFLSHARASISFQCTKDSDTVSLQDTEGDPH